VRASAERVLIEVEDECGGLPGANHDDLFRPFEQRSPDRTGLGVISNEVVHSGFLGKNGRYHTFRSVREETPSEASS